MIVLFGWAGTMTIANTPLDAGAKALPGFSSAADRTDDALTGSVSYDYFFTAPEDFNRSFYLIDATNGNYDVVLEGDDVAIWIGYEDFEQKIVQICSIEDRAAGKTFVFLNKTGAEFRKVEAKGTILPGTKLSIGDDQLASGQILVELYPVGDRGWMEGEPVFANIEFSGLAAFSD